MKTLQEIIDGHKSDCIDGRDTTRLIDFLTEEQAVEMGMEFKDEFKGKHNGK